MLWQFCNDHWSVDISGQGNNEDVHILHTAKTGCCALPIFRNIRAFCHFEPFETMSQIQDSWLQPLRIRDQDFQNLFSKHQWEQILFMSAAFYKMVCFLLSFIPSVELSPLQLVALHKTISMPDKSRNGGDHFGNTIKQRWKIEIFIWASFIYKILNLQFLAEVKRLTTWTRSALDLRPQLL